MTTSLRGGEADATVSARRDAWNAAHCSVFRMLFATCGAVGARGSDAARVVLLTSLAGRFAWHAELLFDLLPVRAGIDRDAMVRQVDEPVRVIGRHLTSIGGGGDDAAVCVVLARVVVPRLVDAVDTERRVTDGRLEGPTVRALQLISRDLSDGLVSLQAACDRPLGDGGAGLDAASLVDSIVRDLTDADIVDGVVDGRALGRSGGLTAPVE